MGNRKNPVAVAIQLYLIAACFREGSAPSALRRAYGWPADERRPKRRPSIGSERELTILAASQIGTQMRYPFPPTSWGSQTDPGTRRSTWTWPPAFKGSSCRAERTELEAT